MRLITLHRILIATMIAFCGYFAWFQARRWRDDGSTVALLLAIACALVGVALTWYLTNLRRFVRVDDEASGPAARDRSGR